MTMQEKIAAMQTKRTERAEVYQNNDGTWGHCMAYNAGFADKVSAQMDLRFCREWERAGA